MERQSRPTTRELGEPCSDVERARRRASSSLSSSLGSSRRERARWLIPTIVGRALIPKSRLFGGAALIAAAWLLAPALAAGFRSEDFLDFEYYSRASLREVVAGSHLGMELLRYWRPLADVVTWGLVHALGPRPWAVHFALVLLHAATAAAAGRALRRTFGLGAGAAWAAALLVLVHPFAPAVLTYVDGGVPTLLAGLCTLLALGELGAWRDGS